VFRLKPYLIAFAALLILAAASWFLFPRYVGLARTGSDPIARTPVPAPVIAPASIPPPVSTEEAVVPVIQRFEADPRSIELGMSTKLSWTVRGATAIRLDHGIGLVADIGTKVVSPATSTKYELTATGASTDTHSAVSVEVKPSAAERARRLYEEAVETRRKGLRPEALGLLRQAAALGDTRAMVDLGESYRDGDGVIKDDSQAAHWFRLAAEAGNAVGMLYLGYMYQEGDGVAKSDSEAVKWFQKAADRGNSSGFYNLATKYERGEGVNMSLQTALELYQKSAQMGNIEAQRRLAQLKPRK